MKRCLLITFSGADGNFGSSISSRNLYRFLNMFYDVEYTQMYWDKKSPSDYEKFDLIVFGGDQIFQKEIYEKTIHRYFKNLSHKPVIIYGSSFGNIHGTYDPNVDPPSYNFLMKKLRDLVPLAVREENDEIRNKYKLDHFPVIDCALLENLDYYNSILESYPIKKKDFSFGYYVYFLQEVDESLKDKIPPDDQLDIVSRSKDVSNINPLNFSIGQWLWIIKNSGVIYTNSFHCYLFSTLFNKRCIMINPNASNYVRVKWFNEYYNVQRDENGNILNYEEVIQNINKHRIQSINYLYSKIFHPITSYYGHIKYPIKKSSSGGISRALAYYILSNHGCVYGAGRDGLFNAKHICINNINEYVKITGSKYTYSKLPDFKEVKKKLDEGKLVMFTGTPCQIKALQTFLEFRDYPNLLTVDLLCTGVFDSEKYKKIVTDAIKNHNWNIKDVKGVWCRWKTEDKKTTENINIVKYNNEYFSVYNDGKEFGSVKSSNISNICKQCPCGSRYSEFKKTNYSDITIGDAWKYYRNYNANYSAIVINTRKGMFYFNNIIGDLYTEEVTYDFIKSYR